MKKITAFEFARSQAQVIAGLKPHESLAVTKHGRTVFVVTKAPAKQRRVRASDLLRDLDKLPMTEADGDAILKEFVREATF